MAMLGDYIEDNDMEGVGPPWEDFGMGHDDFPMGGRRGDRGLGHGAGPYDATFSVCLDAAPGPGQQVMLSGTLPELEPGVAMRACETGSGRLWTVVVNINLQGRAAQAGGAGASGGSMFGSIFGPIGGLGGAHREKAAPLFEVSYSVVDSDGTVIKKEESKQEVSGQPRTEYYHRANFGGSSSAESDEEAFPLFVHDEVHRLQSGVSNNKQFLCRFLNLAACPFAKKRSLLDKALEELILRHWGEEARPPQHTVLAIAAALGCFRAPSKNHAPPFGALYDEHPDISPVTMQGRDEKEKEPPPSLIVCRWIVRHCPTRQEALEEEETAGAGMGARSHNMHRYIQMGVLQAAETLYNGEKTFEWLNLLNFLPEHVLPPPLNSSQIPLDERTKLFDSFQKELDKCFQKYTRDQAELKEHSQEESKERQAKAEEKLQHWIETFLRGLCLFCPSIKAVEHLIQRVQSAHAEMLETVVPLIFNRLRSLHFGKEDKDALDSLIKNVPFMRTDDCAIALLTNQHHPSEAFGHQEIVSFVKLTTTNRDGPRPAGPQLQSAMRRWLMRNFGRPPEQLQQRAEQRKDDKSQYPQGPMSKSEYVAQKEEIRQAISIAIKGWHMVLDLSCFKQEEETLRMILFELSQAYFFKDPDPLMVLDCLLDLESEIEQFSGVAALKVELQRIAIKSVRDAQDTSEVDHATDLLRLLFDKPTPLRFIIIEAFIGFRQAAADLGKILANEPIWTRLLSPAWRDDRTLPDYPLGQTQKHGIHQLTSSATQLKRGTIHLAQLHTIKNNQKIYEKLVTQISGEKPSTIPQASAKLVLFDTEYLQLRVYVKLFCSSTHIDAERLESLLEDIRSQYPTMELEVAASRFDGLHVRQHLAWLYSLRGSEVFSKMWKEVAKPLENQKEALKQEFIVAEVIPKARAEWEQLAKSMETGSAVLKDIRWCVDLEWAKVQHELDLLESTAPKAAPWVPQAVDLTKAMRLAAKLKEWAPSMLHLREILKQIFKDGGSDPTVTELNTVVKQYQTMWSMQLSQMIDQVAPYRDTINKLTEPMQDYVIAAAKHNKSIEWLLQQGSTEDFNRLLQISRPNTDDPIILAALASLQQTRTFLAEALYTKPPYDNLKTFLEELATLQVDDSVHAALEAVQKSFDPMLDLLTKNARTPGVQACYDLKKIFEHGTFSVICASKESEQIMCQAGDDATFNYEALAELRRNLLMTEVPKELAGATNLPQMLQELIEKFQLLEEYGRCTMQLLELGHFAYEAGKTVLSVGPLDSVDSVEDRLKALQEQLDGWQKAVDNARGQYYYLNYFTVREICFLVKTIPLIANEQKWLLVSSLLRVIDPDLQAAGVKDKVNATVSTFKNGATTGQEQAMLVSLGQLLDSIFQESKPRVRRLERLNSAKQNLQGDLLIAGMHDQEQGIPVFVCCAEESSKVTELVLSIYARRERVPEAEELLLCSGNTTLEEIELLLLRFFLARRHARQEQLYCIGNIHLLPYVVQCGTVEALRRLEERFGFSKASALVFVSGQQDQMLTNALSRHNIAVSILPRENLLEAVKRVGEQYHGRQLEAVASALNGVGKSHCIARQIQKLQKQNGDKPMLHHVEIRETTDIASLVAALLRDPTSPKLPTAIHIDLAHILPSHVDTLLFEVLVVGMLRDTKTCAVYHRRTQDFFFVEIPNTPHERTAKQLSFCLLLPRTYLKMGPEMIDPERPVIKSVNGAPVIEFEHNKDLGLVGKTLKAMSLNAFNPRSPNFDVGWQAANRPEIEGSQAYALLEEICGNPPCFLVFMNFVKFLGGLVRLAEEWNMMNLNLLQQFDPGLKHFKHCFFRLLIETSRDFALRQVPKGMDNVAASPLETGRPGSVRRTGTNPQLPEMLNTVRAAAAVAATQAQAQAAVEMESSGIGRMDSAAYVKRFDQMPAWESCVHPIASFKKNDNGNVIGCNIMSLANKEFLAQFIDRNLQNSLNLNDLKLEKDWSNVTHQEAVNLVHLIEGGALLKKKDHLQGPKDYVVTVDNLLKLMSIQQRLKYGLPVILMGETGCGKTALVKFLAQTLDFALMTLDIHGGITDETIMGFLDRATENADEEKGVLVFFDEINAANCMALFKTVIIDRMYGNKCIPSNVRIISCCNPYRLRNNAEMEEVALVFQHQTAGAASGISDPMKRLVYRVHPLPESLIDIVSDFGALSEKSEDLYINAILRKELPRADDGTGDGDGGAENAEYDVFITAFKQLLCQSQSFVREVNEGERSVVSMRDISRAARVFKWFLTYYSKLRGVASPAVSEDKDGAMKINTSPDMRPHLRSAVILTLGFCYHARLNRNPRWGYRKRLCDTWQKMRQENAAVEWLRLDNDTELEQMLVTTQYEFVSQMDLGPGIALNEALRENLFMLLVSVMNQIPILIIGKPGCSKSLAMNVLQTNLNGEVSTKDFFKSMPSVEVFAYQCSPLSTPEAILSAFHSARQSNLGNKKTIVCVLLDEVGLAEESPHLPLKVLHRELEDLQGIACVGISNWALDAAKMSRCVTLYRPPPEVEDLCVTASGMVQSEHLRGFLRALSEAFHEIYERQRRADFWGMREFYSTVRVINAELETLAKNRQEAVLDPKILMKTVQRNFGGVPPNEQEVCIEEFFERTGMSYEDVTRFTTSELIHQNLLERDARHLMLLTKNNAALRLLFESGLLDHDKAEVMFGSTFPNDQSDIFVAMNLQRIKTFMQQPICLVMVHCDSLYESLYDLLNQHYMEYSNQRYVRIAHGSKAKLCPIHDLFRVVVITEIRDAYYRLAPPLLNRFEKQIFLRKDLMSRADEALLNKLFMFWNTLMEYMGSKEDVQDSEDMAELLAEHEDTHTLRPIAGYHPELLSSLVFTLKRRNSSANMSFDDLFEEAQKMLTQVLTPEAVCITATKVGTKHMRSKFGFNVVSEYFEQQKHSDLPSFSEGLVTDKNTWCDDFGAQVMVMTYSPIRGKVGSELRKVLGGSEPTEVSLHELSSSTDIEKAVEEFYEDAPTTDEQGRRFLLIHADPAAASLRMIEHCRFVCEKTRSEYKKKGKLVPSSTFVILVVHLQRGVDGRFSFDFDSQWQFVFLDSVEPSSELSSMPSLGEMLHMPLIEVVKGLDFPKLLKNCFRSSLSRLIYPHSRRPEDLQRQICLILQYLNDSAFVTMIRDWVIGVLETTPKNPKNEAEGTVGQDRDWFAAIATAAHELALAGTFRAALHNRVVVLASSLLTVLLAHLDRNGGLTLLNEDGKRDLWLSLSTASLTSPLSARLHNEAKSSLKEVATAQHEVGTDAATGARPFGSRFPASWFVSKGIDALRHIIESLQQKEQLPALESQYQLSKLQEIGLDPALGTNLLDDYLSDFTAMHLDWTPRIDRTTQKKILKKTIQRIRGCELTTILEVHQLFWTKEKQVAYSISLLNAVPNAVEGAMELIEKADLETMNLDLLLLVHETLTNELLQNKFEGSAQNFCREWLQRKQVVSGLTQEFLATSGLTSHAKLKKLKTDWEPRVETLALLLQYVTQPLNLDVEVVQKFLTDLPTKIRHSKSLMAILRMAERVKGIEGGLSAVGAFCESWFLDVCLRDAEAISDLYEEAEGEGRGARGSCLRLVCGISAGLPVKMEPNTLQGVSVDSVQQSDEKKDSGIAELEGGARIPRSPCLNLALLRKLTVTAEGDAKKEATQRIEALLQEIAEHEKHNDTTFSTRYAVLCEEGANKELSLLTGPQDWPSMTLEDVFGRKEARSAQILQDVGKIRWMLTRYAEVLCADPIDEDKHKICADKVDALLQTTNTGLAPVCRSLRLYLLKCIERQRGISFLRGLLAEAPLDETNWVMRWRDLNDIDFEKFIGAALVPKWDPFSGEDATPEYRDARNAVFQMMNSTATEKLEKFASECAKHGPAQQKREIGSLLLALCQETGLYAALEDEARRPPWRVKLNDWLKTTKDLPVTDQERLLLRIFAGDETPIRDAEDPHKECMMPFVVAGGRKMDDLLRWRFLGHLASVLIAAPSCSLLSTLRSLMLDPSSLKSTFLPGMDEDIRNRIYKALLERGENIWKFKAHWYKCDCGYTFFIGECGRPMEVAKCPQCDKKIGGTDHNKTESTAEDDESDRSPVGYMLPTADKDEKHISFREVPSSSARAVRLLLHGAMFIGIASKLKNPMERIFDAVINHDSMCTLAENHEAKYIGDHFAMDFQQMVDIVSSNTEDLAAVLHKLLTDINAKMRDDPKGSVGGAAGSEAASPNWEKLNLAQRNSWEETIEANYLNSMVKDYDSCHQELYRRWGGAAEDGKFVAELKETADVSDFPRTKRETDMPQLWAFRSAVTLDALHARIGVQSNSTEMFPVLCNVLHQPLFSVLRALGCLVGVFEWHSLVMNHFNGRITREEAKELEVGNVMAQLEPAERQKWESAYAQFELAWHIAWPHVERHECLVVTENLRKVMISKKSAMVWCIADETNEGICALALTRWLVERHNELVQTVSNVNKHPGREVSSRLLGQHDVVHCDEREIMRFLRSRCVTYGIGGKLNFDFKQLEDKLRRDLAKPGITVELRQFQWLGESYTVGNELRTVVRQRDLPLDVCDRIRKEITHATMANLCLQKVQMSVSFILKAGVLSMDSAGSMPLSEYLRTVLSEGSDALPSVTARNEVHLSHVDAFAKLLKSIINKDPMDNIEPKYKVDLPEELASRVLEVRKELPEETLVDILSQFAESVLKEAVISDEIPMLDTLREALSHNSEAVRTVEQLLPPELQMKHWASLYKLLRQRS